MRTLAPALAAAVLGLTCAACTPADTDADTESDDLPPETSEPIDEPPDDGTGGVPGPGEEAPTAEPALSSSARTIRAATIRDTAAAQSLSQGWLLAGIADAETQMAHCWSELTWACQGPASSDCGGGPTVAGAGDGPCYLQQGGIGMFQFDAGTFADTLRREGDRILSVSGNVDAAIDFVVDMVIRSQFIAGVSTRDQAIAWLNGVSPNNARFTPWIQTVTSYYNGCFPSYSCYPQRYAHYRDHAVNIYYEFGADFWSDTGPLPGNVGALEVYWRREPSGAYQLHALASPEVTSVVYSVDDFEIAAANRADSDNFSATYTFTQEGVARNFRVDGYDADGELVAAGVGLIDVTADTAVYIKQMGEGLYEIGLERAPAGVAAIEVRADDYLLTDGVSNSTRPVRNAVRTTFNTLGPRQFAISTFNADGTLRGTLRRSMVLR